MLKKHLLAPLLVAATLTPSEEDRLAALFGPRRNRPDRSIDAVLTRAKERQARPAWDPKL